MITLKYKPLVNIDCTSEFGIRDFGGYEYHPGEDYKAKIGDNIFAVDDGIVKVANLDKNGYGNYTVIQHSNYCTLSAHQEKLELKVGQKVKAGDVIGHVGMTGMTTGPHLHFEIRDCLYDSRFWIKGNLKGRHAMCISPREFVEKAQIPIVKIPDYIETPNKTRIITLKPDELGVVVYENGSKPKNVEHDTFINGTFFFWDKTTKRYKNSSILYANGKIYDTWSSNYYPKPQDGFALRKDGTMEFLRFNSIGNIKHNDYEWIITGYCVKELDKIYKYYDCGFPSDVARKCNKTCLGYNIKKNELYFITRPNIADTEKDKYDLEDLSKETYDNGVTFDWMLRLDSGSSTCMYHNGKALINTSRVIHNYIYKK